MAGSQNLTTLLQRVTIEDDEEVVRASDAALKTSKGDLQAQHVKVVALLKLERYEDALRLLEGSGSHLQDTAQLEHAYALYRVGKLDEAQKIAKEIIDSRGARHVEAQASYRLEDFAHAASLYKDISSHEAPIVNEQNDLRINSGAVDAQLEYKRLGHLAHKRKATREDLETFEATYNAACGCIARGELSQGAFLLQRAYSLCLASDDLTEQGKRVEMLPIMVQQLYVHIALGQAEQAAKVASNISLQEVPDLSTRQIAQINKLVTSSDLENPYLSHRIFHSTVSLPHSDKLFRHQVDIKLQDRLALELKSSKFTGVANFTAKLLLENPSPTTFADVNIQSISNAAAHAQNQLGKLGLKSILPLLEKRPKDVGLIMTIIYLYVLTNNHGSAIRVLESFLKRLDESSSPADQDVRYAPGLVATLVSLYSIQRQKVHIKTELMKAATYWRSKSRFSTGLLRAAGVSLLDSSTPEDLQSAGEIFDILHKQDPKDRFAITGKVAAYATTDPDKVKDLVDQLTPVNRLISDVDLYALEKAGIPQQVIPSAVVSKKRTSDEQTKPIKKRVRKDRLPKDYDEKKAPDPERWLPLRDRSSYRPKGKKGKQKVATLTQGGVSEKGAEGLNMAAPDAVMKPTNSVISGPSKPKKKKPKK